MSDCLPSASLAMLRRRAELLKQVRRFFDERGFFEVETPVLSHDTVVDRHLDPLSVTLFGDARRPDVGEKLWLQTSPEFGMKRLVAAWGGGGRPAPSGLAIYQIGKAFRGGEVGALHNPEFTMVEWYRVGDGYEAGLELLAELAREILGGEVERLTFQEAFVRYAGVDPSKPLNRQALPAELRANPADDMILDYLQTTRVEPMLGSAGPTILYDYPASQSALARVREGNPPVAERFELYYRGVELANGYHELLDPAVLRKRNRENNQLRAADGKYTLPEESRLLEAMEQGLPACSGCALGFDRLVMVAEGAKTIQEVMAFPVEQA